MIDKVRLAVERHNKAASAKLDADQVVSSIVALGGVDEETMLELTADHLIACGIPELASKALVKGFAAGAAPAPLPATKSGSGGMQTAVMMDASTMYQTLAPRALIEGYQLDNPGIIGAELTRRLDEAEKQFQRRIQRAFLIFVNGTLDVDASATRFELIIQGKRVADIVIRNDIPIRPLCVNDRLVVDAAWINPLYPFTTLLDPDQTCEFTHLSWSGVSNEIRGILILANQSGKLRNLEDETARSIIAVAKGPSGLRDIRARYPHAAADWAALPDDAKTPVRIVAAPPETTARNDRPAGGGARRPFSMGAEPSGWTGRGVRIVIIGTPGDPITREIATHLAPARRAGRLQFWHRDMIAAAEDAVQVTEKMISEADIALLVVSADFIDGMDDDAAVLLIEQAYRAKRICVIPVIARPVELGHSRDDAHGVWFAPLTRVPRNEQPITAWADRAEALAEVASQVNVAVAKFAARAADAAQPSPSPNVRAGRALEDHQLRAIHALAIKEGLAKRRDNLLVGLPPEIQQGLPEAGRTPADKIYSDIHELARIELVSGDLPLVTWLRNAIATKPYALEATFGPLIEQVTGAPYRSPSDAFASTQR
jgi:hypothetical protein